MKIQIRPIRHMNNVISKHEENIYSFLLMRITLTLFLGFVGSLLNVKTLNCCVKVEKNISVFILKSTGPEFVRILDEPLTTLELPSSIVVSLISYEESTTANAWILS